MEVLTAKVTGISVSFRRVLDYNYHRTYPLPPPTTILGFLGAAMGYSDKELWNKDNPLRNIRLSVISTEKPGFAQDMWTLQKIKGNRITEKSPYLRELLFYPRYTLIFGGEKTLLNDVESALKDPEYALSLGREDELIRITSIQWKNLEGGSSTFCGTILPFDIRDYKFHPHLEEGIFIEPPVIDKLPTAFKVDKKGIRHPLNKKTYSFIPNTLKVTVENFSMDVLSIDGCNFVWLP